MTLVLCLIFFVSGCSALLFETLWFRLAGLSFGNSLWASSVVLAAFMGGLALGNFSAARFGARLERPLRAYAAIEILIAVFGLGLVVLFPTMTPALASVLGPFLDSPFVLHTLRLGLAFVLLLVPATAMGMTLPVLVKTMSSSDANFGRVLGRLYGVNTLGAVAGALLAELVLIDALGLRGAGVVAAGLNVLAAAMSLIVAGSWASRGARETQTEAEADRDPSRDRRGALSLLAAAFASGMLLLGLEVVWFRFLQLFVAGTSLIFAVMLAVVLLGIGAGGLLASVWLGARPRDYRGAPFVAVAAAVLTAFTYILFDDGYGWYGGFPIKPVPEVGPVFAMTLFLCGPVSLCSGILFTFLGRALRDRVGDETQAAALLTLSNTLGAMVGALLAGFALIPVVGVEGSVVVLGATYFLVCFLSRDAYTSGRVVSREQLLLPGLGMSLAVLLYVFFPFGLMRNHYVPMTTIPHMTDGSQLVSFREGRTETAIYLRADLFGEPRQYRLITNGYAMSASTLRSERYMRLFAYWPGALHPNPRKALLISYGVGLTADALTDIEALESIDVVDISRDLLDLNREVGMFPDEHPLDDERVRVHIEDGRFFLQATSERFDIITAEPPPPKNAGVVNLYTKEYFQLLHDRLAPGGFATYWLPVYQLALDESKAITRAFCDAFADCSMWSGAGTEWMLVGGRGDVASVTDAELTRAFSLPAAQEGLDTIGVERPSLLGTTFLGDAAYLAKWTAEVAPLSDNFPNRISSRWQYRAADYDPAMAAYSSVMDPVLVRERFESSEWIRRHWPRESREVAKSLFWVQALIDRHFEGESVTIPEIARVLEETDLQNVVAIFFDADAHDIRIARRALETGTRSPAASYFEAVHYFSERDYRKAVSALDSALAMDPGSTELAQYRILALTFAGDTDDALREGRTLRASGTGPAGLPGFWDWFDSRE